MKPRIDPRIWFAVSVLAAVSIATQLRPLAEAKELEGEVGVVEGRVVDVQRGTRSGTTRFEYSVVGHKYVIVSPWIRGGGPGSKVEVTYVINNPSVASLDAVASRARARTSMIIIVVSAIGFLFTVALEFVLRSRATGADSRGRV